MDIKLLKGYTLVSLVYSLADLFINILEKTIYTGNSLNNYLTVSYIFSHLLLSIFHSFEIIIGLHILIIAIYFFYIAYLKTKTMLIKRKLDKTTFNPEYITIKWASKKELKTAYISSLFKKSWSIEKYIPKLNNNLYPCVNGYKLYDFKGRLITKIVILTKQSAKNLNIQYLEKEM